MNKGILIQVAGETLDKREDNVPLMFKKMKCLELEVRFLDSRNS
jgi:hypothetical protein